MTFKTIGLLPASGGKWHVREGGGHIWLVAEDPTVGPYVIYNGVLTPVVDAADEPAAPLVMPKLDA